MRMSNFSTPLPQNPELQDFLVENAVSLFNRRDKYLLEIQIDEICMCARIAFYRQSWLWKQGITDYVVDLEYNRGYAGIGKNTKRLDGGNIRLDLIVHKRGYDASAEGFTNIICIEMKKASNPKGCDEDEVRLRKLTDPEFGFCYRAGYMLYAEDKGRTRKMYIRQVFRGGKTANLTSEGRSSTVSDNNSHNRAD